MEAVGGLEIGTICPSHGLIWRRHIPDIIAAYRPWAANAGAAKAPAFSMILWWRWQTLDMARFQYEAGPERLGELKELKEQVQASL